MPRMRSIVLTLLRATVAACRVSAGNPAVVLWTISYKRAQAKGPLLKLLPFE